MGTSWSVRVVDAPARCATVIADVLAGVIEQMSNWEAQSDICRFNMQAIGAWTILPDDMLAVLKAGLEVARLSDGAFDPAVGRLVERWGFGPAGITGPETVSSHRSPWTAIEIDDKRVRRMADVALDFSGIAKGFAVDAVAQALRDLGAVSFLVEVGGELRGEGIAPDLQPWWVDVEAPPGIAVPILRIALHNLSVATSGDYRRFRTEGGKQLSHSINPVTGSPIDNDVASVTVLHKEAMLADAWATAITVAGPDLGMALATREQLAVHMVVRSMDGAREYMTPALAAMLE